jgi:hypothetical protein
VRESLAARRRAAAGVICCAVDPHLTYTAVLVIVLVALGMYGTYKIREVVDGFGLKVPTLVLRR